MAEPFGIQGILRHAFAGNPVGNLDQRIDAAADALENLLLTAAADVIAQEFHLPREAVRASLKHAWSGLLDAPTRRQRDEVRAFVARVLQQEAAVPAAAAAQCAAGLVQDPDEAGNASPNNDDPIASAVLEKARTAVVGIDVIYSRPPGGRGCEWRRQVRVFVRNGQGRIKEVRQQTELAWIDLPGEVRRRRLEQERDEEQRFILYGTEDSAQ